MKKNYLFALIILFNSSNLFGQEIKVGNSFIIVINKEVVSGVKNLRFTFKDKNGKEEFINGGYLPGALLVDNVVEKKKFDADSTKRFLLKFDRFSNNMINVYSYEIGINQEWLGESYVVVKIFDSKRKYKYFLEVPGRAFPIDGVTVIRKR